MVKVALIGAGYIGSIHADILHNRIPKASLVGIFDSNYEKAGALGRKLNVDVYNDYEHIIKDSDCDVAAICTPTFMHPEMVYAAADSGKNIFCEKPLANTLEEANAMLDNLNNINIKMMVGHVLRFWPVYVKVKEIIDSEDLGKVHHAYCERLLTMPTYTEAGWNQDKHLSGGAALDVQVHDLDYLNWIFGMPISVESQGVYNDVLGGWCHIQTMCEYKNGEIANIQAGWGFPESFPFTMGFRFMCENGTLEYWFRSGKLLEDRETDFNLIVYRKSGEIKNIDIDQTDAFYLQWKYFIDCIDEDRTIENATLQDARNAVLIATSTMESAEQKKKIYL